MAYNKSCRFWICGIVLVFWAAIAAIFFIVFTRERIAVNSGSFTNTPNNVSDSSWRTSTSRANGSSRVDYTFSATDLEAMHVSSTNSGGRILLVLIQGDTERIFDITSEFNSNIDMNDFEPGRIRLRLEFTNAENVEIVVNWSS